MTTALATLQSDMERLDSIASDSQLLATQGSPFSLAIKMATSIGQIRAALTDAVMNEVVMPLMNSKLGFRTDKDPSRPAWNKNTKKMEAPTPYPVSIVRECAIEATLRGLPMVGNCWNIISGQSYVTKEGFWFLIGKRVPGLTDFKVNVGVPKMIRPPGDARNASDEEAKGAVVTCYATWKMNGVPDRTEREIPIRVNAMMGADAIMGKAERKILAAAYAQITGTMLGDADTSEADPEFRDVTPPADRQPDSVAKSNPLKKAETTQDPAPAESVAAGDSKDGPRTTAGRNFLNEADERAGLTFDIKETAKLAEITLQRFEGMAKNKGFLAVTEMLSGGGLPIEKLRMIHAKRAEIAELKTNDQEDGKPWA